MRLGRDLSYLDVRPLLVRLSDLDRSVVLVGGQAVGFWSWHYRDRTPDLREKAPIGSKDLDLLGDRNSVRDCARRLGGRAHFPGLDNVIAPQSGVVFFTDPEGVERRLDILDQVFGVDSTKVQASAVESDLLDERGAPSGIRFYVMHPVLVLESRVHNVAGLPDQYDNPKGHEQLRLSILCAHEFMRDLLDRTIPSKNPERAVLRLNERVARFSIDDPHAKDVHARHGIDPAAALLIDDRLPAAFLEKRLPQIQEKLAARPKPHLDRTRGRRAPPGRDEEPSR